ncbi:CHAT domain-containing protein, partial [Mycena vulgaris]
LRSVGEDHRNAYKQSGNTTRLDLARQLCQEALSLIPEGHPIRPQYLGSLAVVRWEYYAISGNRADLAAALEYSKTGLKLTPLGHPDRAHYFHRVAFVLAEQYNETSSLEVLKESTKHFRKAVELTPKGHSQRPRRLLEFSRSLLTRYEKVGRDDDLEAALQNCQTAVMDASQADQAQCIRFLGECFRRRYLRFGDTSDLEAALANYKKAVSLIPSNYPKRASYLAGFAAALVDHYYKHGDEESLEDALKQQQEALHLAPAGHFNKCGYLRGLASLYIDRFRRFGQETDLEAAVENARAAVNGIPETHVDTPGCLHTLSMALRDRYVQFTELKDHEDALHCARAAVAKTSKGDSARSERLKTLAISTRDKFERSRDLKDLESTLETDQEAASLTPKGHPERVKCLLSLGASFQDRFKLLGNLEDLAAALNTFQEVVDLSPEGLERAERLQRLAACLTDRYQRLGDVEDAKAALRNKQEALALTEKGPDRAGSFQNVAVSFLKLYERLEDPAHLEAALQHAQAAVALPLEGHIHRAGYIETLAICFTYRYQISGDLKDLNEALQHHKCAVSLCPEGYGGPTQSCAPPKITCTANATYRAQLGSHHQSLKSRPGSPDLSEVPALGIVATSSALPRRSRPLPPHRSPEFDEVIECSWTAIEGHPDRAEYLHGLAISLSYRPEDLEDSLKNHQLAVDLTQEGDPERADRLQNLAETLVYRYKRSRQHEDLEAIRKNYGDSFNIPTSTPERSWTAALNWASFSEEFQPSDCPAAFFAALNLLPDIAWIGHNIPTRHDAIRRLHIGNTTSAAIRVCIQHRYITSAVEIIEQSLAIIFQQTSQLKTDASIPQLLAAQFRQYSSELYSGVASSPGDVAIARNKLLEDIRREKGYEYFLRPRPYNVLCEASIGGPIVILNSDLEFCDAIIIPTSTSGPFHIQLPNVTLQQLKLLQGNMKDLLRQSNIRTRGESEASRLFGRKKRFTSKTTEEDFKDILSWLWTHIVVHFSISYLSPQHDIRMGRIWWLPTGAFIGLPVHACPPTCDFIHSYTPTSGSLLEAYARKPSGGSPKVGIVGVTQTGPGRKKFLGGVKPEIDNVFAATKRHVAECLEDPAATPEAVKRQLENCSWIHLACHGVQDPIEPTKSCLLLYGGVLELETILKMPLPNAEFVFLSACETAMGDAELVNESFHLSGGFITAGFRGAVGTLWSMNDMDGPLVAKLVYSHLFRDGPPQASDAAESLHLAVAKLRARDVPCVRWIPFIHMGV